MRKLSGWKLPVVALVLALSTLACGKTVGEAIDDTTITTRVKTAMLNDPTVGGLRVDVDTFKGVVTLSGRVRVRRNAIRPLHSRAASTASPR